MRFLYLLSLVAAVAVVAAAPGVAQSGSFGNSVVVGDGELLIAEPTTSFRPGAVYVYRRGAAGWQETAQLRAPDAERADGFGTVLAAAGSTLFVGQRAGPVHTFERDGAGWRHTGALAGTETMGMQPSTEQGEWGQIREIPIGCNQYGYCQTNFGIVLAADGDWLLIGEPRGESDGPGAGHQAAVGARTQEGAGVVHVYRRGADGGWTRQGQLVPTGVTPDERFGAAVAIADGHALVGAPARASVGEDAADRPGRVYAFALDAGAWREVGELEIEGHRNANFGASVAARGDRAVIGAPGAGDEQGLAVTYQRDARSGVWSERTRLSPVDAAAGDRFGAAVAIAGEDAWIGVPRPRGIETGSVYIYPGAIGAGAPGAARRIELAETVEEDAFGSRVHAGEGIAVVTALGMHHGAGSVHLYERGADGEWSDGAMLVSPPDALDPLLGEVRGCANGSIGPFECDRLDLLAFMPTSMLAPPGHARGVRTNDNWGWTDAETGREYALVGRNDGTAFVDITDPVNPVLVGDLPKTQGTPRASLWRDVKVYDDHAFVVADAAGPHGMQVFDLTRLRDVTDGPVRFEADVVYRRINSAHNVVINEESGFAYIVGASAGGETCGGGLHIVDIRDPLNPTFQGCFTDPLTGRRGTGYTHDAHCAVYQGPDERYQGREICLGANENMLSIADVTDEDNPVALSRASYPDPAYLHQGWLTEDHRYFFMNDEADVIQGSVETTRTMVFDVSDLEDPVLVREFMGSMPASAHNLYIEDGLMYQANYRYGLHVLDVSDPLNPREIGYIDTSPYLSGPGFSAAWSNYPFFEDSVIVTSLQEGLFVVRKPE